MNPFSNDINLRNGQSGPAGKELTQDEIRRHVESLGEWFHNMNLAGVWTAPYHFLGNYPTVKWERFVHTIPDDLTGKTVLDVGCNGGFYSLEMKRRGAQRVVAIDVDATYLAQARFAAQVYQVEIEFHQLSVYDVDRLGEVFDFVLFMGVLYHLRHPLLALDKLATVVRERLIFQTMIRGSTRQAVVPADFDFWEEERFQQPDFPCAYFVENSYAGDPSNWWIPNRPAAEAMLRSAGFEILEHPETEVWICRPRVSSSGSRDERSLAEVKE
jgi:tRNA (mo5U34)-methyltransferase